MFKFLKDKLKDWKDKIKEEFKEPEEKIVIKPAKKSSKKVSEKVEKKLSKKEPIKEEKKSFIENFLGKKKDEKIADMMLEDIKKEQEIESPEKKFEDLKNPKSSFLDKFKRKLDKEKFDDLFQELEVILLQNNVAYDALDKIKEKLGKELIGKNLSEISLGESLKQSILEILINPPNLLNQIREKLKEKKPYVIVLVGINGSGKTTTIAKLTNYLQKNKFSVCLAAADTFRAGAIDQLNVHAEKLKVPLIKKDYGSDPASVGFDSVAYAKKHSIEVVLIDTAGRMNTKDSLMKEMEKITRVCNPDLKIFVGESITGNDATEQARAFNDQINLDGIILSKADIDEKGGTALSVSYITGKPIYFLGTGQTYNDFEIFDKEKIVKNLGL